MYCSHNSSYLCEDEIYWEHFLSFADFLHLAFDSKNNSDIVRDDTVLNLLLVYLAIFGDVTKFYWL